MTGIVVDSNVIFSALRGGDSKARDIILGNSDYLYFAPNYLIGEIFKYKAKILKNSKATEAETLEFLFKILHKVQFVNEEDISTANFIAAYRLCKDTDEKDTPFVALSLELSCPLWTRDTQLKTGLRALGFDNFFEE